VKSVSSIDIEKHKKVEEKLRESELKYQKIINHLDVGFYQVTLEGKILTHNPTYNKILGLDISENLKNTSVTTFWEKPELREDYLKQLVRDGFVKNYTCHVIKKDGSKIVLQLNSHLIRDKEGKPIRIDGVFIDVTEKFSLEKKLKESEKTYRSLFENSIACIAFHKIIYDSAKRPINYIFTDVNPAFEKILKIKRDKVIDRLATEVYDVEYPPYFDIYLKVAETMKSEFFTTFFEPLRKNFKISAFSFEVGKFITVFGDITEEILKEIELKEAHSEIEQIFNLVVPIYVIDPNYTITEANETFISLLKMNRTDLIGAKCYDIWQGPNCKTSKCSLKQHTQGFDKIEYETYKILSDGTELSLLERSIAHRNSNGEVITVFKSFMDITQRKAIEEKLKESQEKYRDLLDTSSLGILDINLVNREIEYFNPKLLELLGYSKEELIDTNLFYKIVHPEDIQKLFKSRDDGNIEFRIDTKDGKRKWIACNRLFQYNKKGELIKLRLWMHDISERKKGESLKKLFTEKLEKEVQSRTKDLKELLEKQKLYLGQIEKSSRFKTEFMATMSHELRTPLNAIIGFTDLLLESVFGELNEEQLEFVKDIDESSNHLLEMITDILDISKIEADQVILTIEEIHLNNLVNHVISTLKPLYNEKGLIIDLKGLKKEQLIFADRIKFKQIIYNLLSNAIKFTEKGKVTFEFRDNKDTWDFNVKDTGIGIAEKDFNIIFKDFKRVKSAYVDSILGSGLGLALTKRIVNLHGGDILFTSKLGKGTTFTFTIPKNLRKKVNREIQVESFLSKL